jgi:hypothetical protein
MNNFWEDAWRISRTFGDQAEGDGDVDVEPLREISIQRYVFEHKSLSNPNWLSSFRAAGLFSNPPSVQTDGDLRWATGWPIMTYLRKVASTKSVEVAEILTTIFTDNWWVLGDAMGAATELGDAHLAAPVILHILKRMQETTLMWASADQFVSALKVLSATGEIRWVVDGSYRIVDVLFNSPLDRFELDQVLTNIRAGIDRESMSGVADGLEVVLCERALAGKHWRTHVAISDLATERPTNEPSDILVAHWAQLVTESSQGLKNRSPIPRAVKMLTASSVELQRLGVFSLRQTLRSDPVDPGALAIVVALLANNEFVNDADLSIEFLPLLTENWEQLPIEVRAQALESYTDFDPDDSSRQGLRQRYFVRDFLSALRDYLGDVDRYRLQGLEHELGKVPNPRLGTATGVVFMSGPDAMLLDNNEVHNAKGSDLLSLMRYVPGQPNDAWSVSESLARQIKPEVERRPVDFLPLLDEIAETVPYSAVVANVIWGFQGAFGDPEFRNGEYLDLVLRFMVQALDNASRGRYQPSLEFGPSTDLAKVSADFLGTLSSLVVAKGDPSIVAVLITRLLSDTDPEPGYEEMFDRSDPPTLSLGCVRGKALRAALALLSEYWARHETAELRSELERIILLRSRTERSPAVLSVYGFYLAQFISYWPEFLTQNGHQILPIEKDAEPRWSSVFVTHLMFGAVTPEVMPILRNHYELASKRTEDKSDEFLLQHGDNLLVHLIVCAIRDPSWHALLEAVTVTLESDAVRRGVIEFLNGVPAEIVSRNSSVCLTLVKQRVDYHARMGMNIDPQEGRALIKLVLATQLSIDHTASLLKELLRRGSTVDLDDILRYLRTADPEFTQSGLAVLEEALKPERAVFVRGSEQLVECLDSYRTRYSERVWVLLNDLGSVGYFALEDLALSVFETL